MMGDMDTTHTADAPRDRLDFFPSPSGSGPAPAVLVLPGGGYEVHAPHEAEPVARWLNGLGLAAFVLRYPVAPNGEPEPLRDAPLEDARAAMRAIREGAGGSGVDPSRVGVLGFSAGAHLAAVLASGPRPEGGERPDLAVLCYPLISFAHQPHVGSLRALLGEDATLAQRWAASAEASVHPDTPPVFSWHTADDRTVDVEHSLRYAAALSRAGVPVELHVLPHGPHGLGLAPEDPYPARWTEWCADWFASHGWR